MVQYTPTENTDEYNLGFGDYDPVTNAVSDTIKSNNGDRDKVLATVAATATDFLNWHPKASILATGSTDARTRTYQIGISRFYDEITPEHDVFGLRNDNWEVFESN